MPPQALAALATLLAFTPHGNRIDLRLDHGSAELVWITDSTFRFRRVLEGPLTPAAAPPAAPQDEREALDLRIEEDPAAVRVRSRLLEVSLRKRGLLVTVRGPATTPGATAGETLMADLSEPQLSSRGVDWERRAPAGGPFYGLGTRTDAAFDLRGQSVRAENPLLLSTGGYGEYHTGSGPFVFDFTAPGRYRVEAPAVDYYFFYGPTPKRIFEESHGVRGATAIGPAATGAFASWSTLQSSLLRLVHAAISGMDQTLLSLAPYAGGPPELLERARQVASLVPGGAAHDPSGARGWGAKLASFLQVYEVETRDRGFPLWHPLPFQFPADPECARHADEFLLGDEMLIAPIYQPGNRRSVYLPPGLWTNLETNAATSGRRTIDVETASLPVFAHNGTIVPLDAEGEMELHYFPTLAAEFFLLEREIGEWTQVHAAPATDVFRLEIEARKARDYQWVVHHVERPAEVSFGKRRFGPAASMERLEPGAWFWDARLGNLHIRLHAAAGEDAILNVAW